MRLGGPRKDGTVRDWSPNAASRAASFQTSVTCRYSQFGVPWSDCSRTAVIKSATVASLTASGSIPRALA